MATSTQSKIRWQQKDYLSLGRAVANFNKKINELQKQEKKLYLPELKNYKDIKENIQTRSELNRVINSLKRFSKEGAEDLYVTKSGEQLTKWERGELGKQIKIAERGLKESAKALEIPMKSGYSKAQMGSQEYREILANLRSLKNLELKKGGDFTRMKERIAKYGNLDYKMVKATIFRENFKEALKQSGAENFENFSLLQKKMNRIKNPINFYEFIKNSNVFMDIFDYYKPGDGIIYGDFIGPEERFNFGLEELELL